MWSPPSDQPDFLQSALPVHLKITCTYVGAFVSRAWPIRYLPLAAGP